MAESAHDENYVPKDFSKTEIMRMAEEAIRKAEGRARVYFKFTCASCKQRCTFSEPNKLYSEGECFACGKKTKVEKAGFLLILSSKGRESEWDQAQVQQEEQTENNNE